MTTRSIQPWCSSRTPSVAASAARGQAGPGVHRGHVAILIPHDKFLQSVKIRSCTCAVADTEEGETATTRSSMVACFFQNISCIFNSLRKDTLVLMIEANSPFERVLLRGMMVSRMTRPVNTQVNDYKWWFWTPEELFALNTWMSAQSERSRCRWWGRGWRCWWWRSPGFQHWMHKTKGTNIIE